MIDLSETPLLYGREAPTPPLLAEDRDYVPARGYRAVRKVFWIETVKLWKIAAPIALNLLCEIGTNSVTSIFIGHLGELEPSAMEVSLSVIGTFSLGSCLAWGVHWRHCVDRLLVLAKFICLVFTC